MSQKGKYWLAGIISFVSTVLVVLAIVFIVKKVSPDEEEETTSGGGWTMSQNTTEDVSTYTTEDVETTEAVTTEQVGSGPLTLEVDPIERPSLLRSYMVLSYEDTIPTVPSTLVSDDMSDVINADQVYLEGSKKEALVKNQFVVVEGSNNEFFEVYEYNRYSLTPSFVTVDSMMHTYHLYFSHLMKNTERNYLMASLQSLSVKMLDKVYAQYQFLKGTEWENAAYINVAYFTVANVILGTDISIPEEVADVVAAEAALINDQSQVVDSPLFTGTLEDYSQYKPRGYYDTDEALSRYFKAMMWYGRRNFARETEDLDRSALLIVLAMDEDTLPDWETIYTVTSFFCGTSDDNGYYEYRPVIEQAYGADVTVDKLPGDAASWATYHELTSQLEPPKINSIPVSQSMSDEEKENAQLGFRFMGQRFTIDASVFAQLTFRNVGEIDDEVKRMLPDALDVPAALGSDTALSILQAEGSTNFAHYDEKMTELRTQLENAPEESWDVSLYASWLNTLRPLLEVRGEGYPTFMQSEEWRKKNLVSFLGSYTELKHDTILYSKQNMAELGGGPIDERDDRGYVEPEPEIYARLNALVSATAQGLSAYGMISQEDIDNLALLSELAYKLQVISEKELRNEGLTDEEYDLIRTYGGQLEHFWQQAIKDDAGKDSFNTTEFPSSLVADVATDPNGSCLELGTGYVNNIYVLVTIEGSTRICRGSVYSFYQFEQPLSDRLTDSEWRIMQGINPDENGEYHDAQVARPAWTNSFCFGWGDE